MQRCHWLYTAFAKQFTNYYFDCDVAMGTATPKRDERRGSVEVNVNGCLSKQEASTSCVSISQRLSSARDMSLSKLSRVLLLPEKYHINLMAYLSWLLGFMVSIQWPLKEMNFIICTAKLAYMMINVLSTHVWAKRLLDFSLRKLEVRLTKVTTNYRNSSAPEKRLVITLIIIIIQF